MKLYSWKCLTIFNHDLSWRQRYVGPRLAPEWGWSWSTSWKGRIFAGAWYWWACGSVWDNQVAPQVVNGKTPKLHVLFLFALKRSGQAECRTFDSAIASTLNMPCHPWRPTRFASWQRHVSASSLPIHPWCVFEHPPRPGDVTCKWESEQWPGTRVLWFVHVPSCIQYVHIQFI